jgi:hypothetical protein
VTDTLGEQVRRATEVLIQALDKADEDRNRDLLRGVQPSTLYEAALTVMMRLVFVLCAEERGLFLLGDPVYDENFAVSTLRGQLSELADQYGDEVLERRYDAWTRLSAVFRAVYAGIEHEDLHIPAMGGSLFDPDRFPFLEGRPSGTSWLDTPSRPLPIDDRTVLLLLNSLQVLEHSHGALELSYRSLDVEQIGHVYEGLLEHSVVRSNGVVVGLKGSAHHPDPVMGLAELESLLLDDEDSLRAVVASVTGRNGSAVANDLARSVDDALSARVLSACGGNVGLFRRVLPFAHLIRMDAWSEPVIYGNASFMVVSGSDRRQTGTHYTPRSLTQTIVEKTLQPLAYVGPVDGSPKTEWQLKSAPDLLALKICDPTMGSGAFLVQACRYLSERLVEAWASFEAQTGGFVTADGDTVPHLGSAEPMPSQADDRLAIARTLVCERCLYGVDVNPLAVELAKLSLWLVTLSKGRPFGFLDHNLRCGDSLLGVTSLEQISQFSLRPKASGFQPGLLTEYVASAVKEAVRLRLQLREVRVRDITDVWSMGRLNEQALREIETAHLIADCLVGETLLNASRPRELQSALLSLAYQAECCVSGDDSMEDTLRLRATTVLGGSAGSSSPARPFHWALEYPEVTQAGGFHCVVGNPPFMGGRKISSALGVPYLTFLTTSRDDINGIADLVCHFFRRAFDLIRPQGTLGMVATKSISEVDSRRGSLEAIVARGGTIFSADVGIPWPGRAAVIVTVICIAKRDMPFAVLNGRVVHHIHPTLQEDAEQTEPYKLRRNAGKGRSGSKIMGDGFKLSNVEAESLISRDAKSATLIRDLLGGTDITTSPDRSPGRLVIDPGQMSEAQVKTFAAVYERLHRLVLPSRSKSNDAAKKKYWWRFAGSSAALYRNIKDMDLCVACSRVTKHVVFELVPTRTARGPLVFDESLVILAYDDFLHFGCLSSTHHGLWVLRWGSRMGTTQRYTATEVLETFPFPQASGSQIADAAKAMKGERDRILYSRQCGLTDLYNLIHDSRAQDEDIVRLRELLVTLDAAVHQAYGWDDLPLDHGFFDLPNLPPNDCQRFTLPTRTRAEVLGRLSSLNATVHDAETACAAGRRSRV